MRDETEGGSAIESDSTIFETARCNSRKDQRILVKLPGEFDVRYQKLLEDTLSDCRASGSPTLVDLSEVTFMDSRCLQELAIHHQLGIFLPGSGEPAYIRVKTGLFGFKRVLIPVQAVAMGEERRTLVLQ